MAVALREIINILMTEYPPPDDEQDYTERYVISWNKAVADYNFRATRRKRYEIDVVNSTDLYALPYDFIKIITIDLLLPSGAQQSEGGTDIPYSVPGYVESYQLEGTNIRFVPPPNYNKTKYLWYGAGHFIGPVEYIVQWGAGVDYEVGENIVLNSFEYATCTVAGTSDITEPVWPAAGNTIVDGTVTWSVLERSYSDMVMSDVYVILMKAKVFMIRDTGAVQATGGIRYSLGELTIDRTRQADYTSKAADNLDQQYMDEVKARVGHLLSISYRQAEEEIPY